MANSKRIFTAKDTKDITKKSKGIMLTLEEIFNKILDSEFKVHSALGQGLLESAYEETVDAFNVIQMLKF